MSFLRSKKLWFIVLLLVASGVGVTRYRKAAKKGPVLLGTGKVTRGDLIQRVTIAGSVTSLRKTLITAPYDGYIKQIFVKIGDKVKAGDPLVSIAQSLQSNETLYPMRAPYAGTVVQIEKSEGEFIKSSDAKDFILRIDDIDRLFVVASAPEIDRAKVKLKQEAVIKASAILNRSYKGIITELSLAARDKDANSRSQSVEFPIKIEITDKDEAIKPGMSVLIDVITDKKEKVLMLRHEFIHKEDDKAFAILSNGQRRDLQLGMQNEEGFEVVGGVAEGDAVKQVDYTQIKPEDK